MSRPPQADESHGRPRYIKGCRCPICRKANTEYASRYRRRKADPPTEQPAPAVIPAVTERPPGEVEQAVRDELKAHDGAQGTVALAAIAIALAKEIDDRAATSVAGAARQLVATLTEIRRASVKVDDELARFLADLGG